MPVLIVSGERDFVVPTADARRILAALPSARKRLSRFLSQSPAETEAEEGQE
jgi:pimeloyl-ACP methyl ester carboxylesterase